MKKALFILAFGMAVSHSYAGGKGGVQRSDRKIIEITKIVKLSAAQERTIRMAYDAYNAVTDSALYKVNDPVAASRLKYEAGKEFNEKLMNTFTEAQRNRYIRITSAAEVEAKAKYKTDLLEESGEYTADELAEKKAEIFNYLMAEKVVYARDKYNIRKQKENISRLKNTQPRSLRESNIREKQKGQGRIVNGKSDGSHEKNHSNNHCGGNVRHGINGTDACTGLIEAEENAESGLQVQARYKYGCQHCKGCTYL